MFIVFEIQVSHGKVATLTYQYSDQNEAYAKFHTILAAAAMSSCAVHTAMILTETGHTIAVEHFAHSEEEAE